MLLRQAVLVLEVGFIRTKFAVPNFDFNSEKKIESDLGSFLELYFFSFWKNVYSKKYNKNTIM